jgi:hypothetical protein
MRNTTSFPRRNFWSTLSLPAVAALALALTAAPANAVPRYFPLDGSKVGDTLVLDPDRVIIHPWNPGGNRYEQEGDYLEKKKEYRVAAYETYYARIGAYEGFIGETFVEARLTEDDAPTLITVEMYINLGTPDGDSAHVWCPTTTTLWKAGDFCEEVTWKAGEDFSTRPRQVITIAAVDPGMRKDYPWPNGETTALRPVSKRLLVNPLTSGLRLDPPAWARKVSIHSLNGSRLYSAPLQPGANLELPSGLGSNGPIFVQFL